MWGRWGLRDGLDKHVVVDNDYDFEKIWGDLGLEVRAPIHVSNDKTMLIYSKKHGFEVKNYKLKIKKIRTPIQPLAYS